MCIVEMKIIANSVKTSKGEVNLYTLINNSGSKVILSSIGAGIVSVIVPDRTGIFADITLGYAEVEDYLYDGPCCGKTAGRYANRIARGLFSLDGIKYKLATNCDPNALHGGPEGFQNQIWDSEIVDNKVVFSRISPNGEEGYPGTLSIKVSYSWSENNELEIDYFATTDKKTIVNLTNHCYWNLSGENYGSVLNHKLRLSCSKYLPTDDTLVPTGEYASVVGTPMDFIIHKTLGAEINAKFPALIYGKGYDNCWVVDNWEKNTLTHVAQLIDENSGRVLNVFSTQPAVQIYTGNWLSGSPKSKSGGEYHDYDAVAIECQAMPDAPNHQNFPSTELNPGEEYNEKIIYKFTIK